MLTTLLPVAVLVLSSAVSQTPDSPQAEAARKLWEQRPACESIFVESEWKLTASQVRCDWYKNRLFSTEGVASALVAAVATPIVDGALGRARPTEGFAERFGTNLAQGAFKSTGAYLGGLILHEDPRQEPPFLIMQENGLRHGFFTRIGHAVKRTVVAYRCVDNCREPADIRWTFALSRVTGSLASGFAPEIWQSDRSVSRGLRGSATAYGASLLNAVFSEFKPELAALGGRLLGIF